MRAYRKFWTVSGSIFRYLNLQIGMWQKGRLGNGYEGYAMV